MTDPIVVDAVLLAELKGYLNAIGVDQQLWPKEIKAAYNVGMSPRVVLALIARIEEQDGIAALNQQNRIALNADRDRLQARTEELEAEMPVERFVCRLCGAAYPEPHRKDCRP